MKKQVFGWLLVGIFSILVAGCGDTINQLPVTEVAAPAPAPAVSAIKVLSLKSQELQFVLDEKGNVKDLRIGGIEVKPADVKEVVYVSGITVGDVQTSPFRASFDSSSLKATLTGLPNNDDWGNYYLVLRNGKSFQVLLANFVPTWKAGVYSYITPDSSIQWGEIDSPTAQDWMQMSLDISSMTATLKGQFGCDLIFGVKTPIIFVPGLKVVVEDGNGQTYSGAIVQGADGNLSWEVAGIPVVAGPYAYGNYPGPVQTKIVSINVQLLDGTKVSFNLGNNTDNRNESIYVWYIGTYNTPIDGQFWVEQSANPMLVTYYPPNQQ